MDPFLGEIRAFSFGFAPRDWADCNGQLMSISQNTALFSLLGTQYGGDGRTTFALPDLRARVAIGMGQGAGLSPYYIGQTGGEEAVTLTASQLPSHIHTVKVSNADATTSDPTAGYLATPAVNSRINQLYSSSASGTAAADAIGPTGGSAPHNNLQPLLVVRYCIALQGIFPSRS
jgi:microcystin-dependent protein